MEINMAGEIQAAFDAIYSDGPTTEPDKPSKPLIRTQIGGLLESKITGLEAVVDDLQASGSLINVEDLPSVGERFDDCKALNLSFPVTGVTTTLSSEGYPIGFTIPANVDGRSANISTYPLSDAKEIAALAGRTIYITAVFDATAGFFDRAPLSTAYVDIGRGLGNNGGILVSDKQVGGTVTRTVGYTVIGNEPAIGLIAQVSLAAVAAPSIASLTLRSVTYRVVSTPDASSGAENIGLALRGLAQARFGVSLAAEKYEGIGTLASGLSWLRDPETNNIVGWYIPAGTPGGFTYINWIWYPQDDDARYLGGANIRVTILLETSPDYARVITPLVGAFLRPTGGDFLTNYRVLSQQRSSTVRAYIVEGTTIAGIEQLVVTLQNGRQSGGSVSGDMTTLTTDTMKILDIIVEVLDAPIAGITGAAATARLRHNLSTRLSARKTRLRSREKGATVKIAPAGGDFTTIASAIAGSPAGVRFTIDGAGSYSGSNYPFFYPSIDNLEFAGVGLQRPILAFALPANASLSDIANDSTVDLHHEITLRNLRLTGQNCRYVIHADSSNTLFGRRQVIEDCHLEHLGNDTAKAYQDANGGSGSSVWSNCSAIGAGISDGGGFELRRSTLLGYNFDALHCHNWGLAAAPITVDIEGNDLDPRATTPGSSFASFYWANIGSLQNDVVRLVGNRLGGPVVLGSWPWIPTDPAKVPANKMLATVTGYGNTPAPYVLDDDLSRALRITSATTGTSSSVTVSGTGADALFGGTTTIAGAVGLAGGVYGFLDVGDHLIGPNADQAVTQIGKRLGDCSTTAKTLTVLIDGATTKTVTFNSDYRAVANATILASINTALGSSAVADLFNVNELFRPRFTDEEERVYNSSATTILRKTAVAWATTGRPGVRTMTSTDAARLFAGIAYEDIRPGQWGRVKSKGAVRVSMDLLRSDSIAFAHGDMFGVSDASGRFAVGATIPLLMAFNPADVKFIDWSRSDPATDNAAAAWISFTPTIRAQTGALTTASVNGKYKKIGRQVHFQIAGSITTNGTGSGAVVVGNMPVATGPEIFTYVGREIALNGKALLGYQNNGTTDVLITYYDSTYPGANGMAFIMNGTYEAVS
ncbi:hypothetical protein FBZ98_1011048 [Rhizobium sp. ERR 922]|nr:hypothetical protein FBZ98_1011048 [Rhizobium sp. ERR 922]TWC04629.1 hypothetical protein FBZ97_1011048 [Rhizobium sp. ERR 942]